MSNYYDWNGIVSRQVGTDGEFAMIVGGKGIGKTFGARLMLIDRAIKDGARFVEIFRTKSELKGAVGGYFDKIQQEGFYRDYIFKVDKHGGHIAPYVEDAKEAEWTQICYFCALSNFQAEKKKTYAEVGDIIFDEAIIDSRDRYHRYLPDEFVILANLLDTIFRETPGKPSRRHHVYMLANACNLVNPYFEAFGVDAIPDYGYHWLNGRSCILHYVPPMDAALREQKTFVGRMLKGSKESKMIFENKFQTGYTGDICAKPPTAKYAFTLIFGGVGVSIWIDLKGNRAYATRKAPKDGKTAYKLTKKDGGVNRTAVKRADDVLEMVKNLYYADMLRYETVTVRECLFEILGYLGVK